MVHKKSTYRLNFKNYSADVRKNVWEECNSIRLRRREEEMSHHSIEEDDSECECDTSEDEEVEPRRTNMKNVSVQSQPEMFHQEVQLTPEGPKKNLPNVPRLHFSPESTPRHQKVVSLENGATLDTSIKDAANSQRFLASHDHTEDCRTYKDVSSDGKHLGVMRSRSQDREYDLIPAATEESDIRHRSAHSAKAKLIRSHKYPYTSHLSRTTRKNFQDSDKILYVPCGSGEVVRSIGDQTSFNIHLNKEQVRSTALRASAKRNREIENLIKKQRNISLEDWRGKNNVDYGNSSSVFLSGEKNIFSKSRPKESLINNQHRVRVFSNYCKHCGGHK